MAEIVLDASALLALLNREPGADLVELSLPGAAVSAINLSEVVAKLAEVGMPREVIGQALLGLPLDIVPFDSEQAYEASMLRPSTKGLGMSLGDRGCLSLALKLGLPVLTADRTWQRLSVGVKVRVIR
jgi:PIN domain nuclease of toxin-antitoxin system